MSILHHFNWPTVSIEVQIDPKWTWIARQPWGEYMLFTSKPVIYRAWSTRSTTSYLVIGRVEMSNHSASTALREAIGIDRVGGWIKLTSKT